MRQADAITRSMECRTPTGHSVIQDGRQMYEWERESRHGMSYTGDWRATILDPEL
jgi:hypothetical protein